MSQLPRIATYNNSEGFKQTFTQRVPTPALTTNESQQPNGISIKNPDLPPVNSKMNPYIYESKLNEFQSKLAALEEANSIWLTRWNNNERNFEYQIKELQFKSKEERDNHFKNQKLISVITDQHNWSSNDMQLKINLIQEVIEKDEKWKVQQRERDIEMYKNWITKLTEKVSDTVKMEVEARFKADMDNKVYSQALTNRFENEIDIIRREMEDILNQSRLDIQTISKECSERTHNVSKYIDQQITEAAFGKGGSSENLKNFVHKLTEQVKSNLISQGIKNDQFEERLTKIENHISTSKEETYKFISDVEERWISKMKDLKMYTEMNVQLNNKHMMSMINELSANVDSNIELITNQLVDTRIKTNINFEMMNKQNNDRFKSILDDFDSVLKRVYLYEDILKKYDEENTIIKEKIVFDLNDVQSKFEVHSVNERIIHTIENEMIQEQINRINLTLMSSTNSFSDNMLEINKSAQSNFSNLIERINYLQELIGKIAEKNYQMFTDFQKNSDNMEVKQIMNEMVSKTENEMIIAQIQKSKDYEYENSVNLEELQMNLVNTIKTVNLANTDINEIKTDLHNMKSTTGLNENAMNQQMEIVKKRLIENEQTDGVHKTMEFMLNNVESIMNKEQVDSLSHNSEALVLKSIHTLENKLTSHITSNEKDFNDIFSRLQSGGDWSGLEVKLSLQQMLNHAEFSNIYNILQESKGKLGMEYGAYSNNKPEIDIDIIDNKINNIYEKIKNDNTNMWVNAVELTQKLTQPDRIRQIIKEIPPVVIPMSDSLKRIMDLDYTGNNYPKPYDIKWNEALKDIENEKNGFKGSKKSNNPYNEMNKNNKDNNAMDNENTNQRNSNKKDTHNSKQSNNNQSNKGGSSSNNAGNFGDQSNKKKRDPNLSGKNVSNIKK